MKVGFGKYKNMTIEALVLKEAYYVAWILDQSDPSGPLARAQAEIQRLIHLFDVTPYRTKCYGHDCSKSAKYCTVYQSNAYSRMWWCDGCNPYQMGAIDGKLSRISTYRDAINHCRIFCSRREDFNNLIKHIAQAKGLPQRVGEKQAAEFFV